jgi:hypothetical protein
MSAEIAGFDYQRDGDIAYVAAEIACHIRIEEGSTPASAWSGEMNAAKHAAAVIFSALGRVGVNIDNEALAEAMEAVEQETLPHGRARGVQNHLDRLNGLEID